MLTIDGSFGEGGGQNVRTSLTLSLVTGKPFRMEKIRARRRRPGLMRQHLTAVEAAARIGQAEVSGASVGSSEIAFQPGKIRPGEYAFPIGTAGSTTLVLQTILPALLTASGPSSLVLEGGTHNPLAPPFDFLEKAFLPLVNAMGPRVSVKLERAGFYPAGGGRLTAFIVPVPRLGRLDLLERGAIRARTARAMVANLSINIARRELRVVEKRLGWEASCLKTEVVSGSAGPGNALVLEIASEHVTEVFTGFGERGVSSEQVADRVVDEASRYLAAQVPVGEHLADQLMVLLALAGDGAFRTLPLSSHARTQMEIVGKFLEQRIVASEVSEGVWQVEVGG